MEILVLIMLYYLSQNPDFEKSVKPLLGSIKNSEEMLKFLSELSRFSEMFSPQNKQNDGGRDEPDGKTPQKNSPSQTSENEQTQEKKTDSPTGNISNPFIEELLQKYFTSPQSGKN